MVYVFKYKINYLSGLKIFSEIRYNPICQTYEWRLHKW